MQVTDADRQAMAEAMRRRAGQLPSSAGIPGGAPVANATTPANPIAQAGMVQQPQAPTPTGTPSQNPSSEGGKQLKAADGESTFIIKSMADRLKALTASGQ